jgi:uncharacterized RDD family membrane protein YckC
MSHAGPPAEPPSGPSSEPPPDPDPSGAGSDATGPAPGRPEQPAAQPYNPYPDNWESGSTASTPQTPPTVDPQADPYAQANPYGQPPAYGQSDPYGQQSPYAEPAQPGPPGSPANPYAGAASTKPTFGFGGYASWSTRVGAYLIDQLAAMVAAIPLWIGYGILAANTTTTTNVDGTTTSEYSGSVGLPVFLIVIGAITSIGIYVWNICLRQGRTGASIGKSVLAVRLVNTDLQPIGGGMAFLRSVLHIVDAIPCYLGYFWPIWDSRKQTFADKIVNTFVIHATAPQPPAYPPPPQPYQSY